MVSSRITQARTSQRKVSSLATEKIDWMAEEDKPARAAKSDRQSARFKCDGTKLSLIWPVVTAVFVCRLYCFQVFVKNDESDHIIESSQPEIFKPTKYGLLRRVGSPSRYAVLALWEASRNGLEARKDATNTISLQLSFPPNSRTLVVQTQIEPSS